MARKKVKLEWIANDSARRAAFKKRRKGLVKKVSELSTLCDVKACLIVYGPDERHPEVWPSLPEVVRVLVRLKRLPEMEQSKKMMDQADFMRQGITKLREQIRKRERENRELEMALLMYQCLAGRSLHDVAIEDVTSLACLTEMKVNKVRGHIKISEGKPASRTAVAVKEESTMAEVPRAAEEKTPLEAAMEELQRQDWFKAVMNPHELMVCGNEEVGQAQPYVEPNHPWAYAYFPWN